MDYISTRGQDQRSETVALVQGLAKDGGLFVPKEFPYNTLSYKDVADKSYQEVAKVVLSKLFSAFTSEEWDDMIGKAYNTVNFDTADIVPLHALDEKVTVLELFHGRTSAFKDMALSLFPYLLVGAKEKEGNTEETLILTATSGDTGKAALEGFKDVAGTHIQIFYPTDGVSPMQKEQMQKQEGNNVAVTAIRGNFDDAQQFLKRLFVDEAVGAAVAKKHVAFSSANSINIGRLAPQVVYYVHVYAELVNQGVIGEKEEFTVVVPTGNFGNILAAYYAKCMGVPIGHFICASNRNNVLTEFFETGTYNKEREFFTTLSPSMDIIESSNFERFLYYMTGQSSERISELMGELKSKGAMTVTAEEKKDIDKLFTGAYVDDEETKRVIAETYHREGYLLDPHTAVAVGAYEKVAAAHPEIKEQHAVIAATAHPFKFPQALCEALKIPEGETARDSLLAVSAVTGVAFPKPLADLANKDIRFTKIIEKETMKDEILAFVDSFTAGK